jgi:hypothetical protein
MSNAIAQSATQLSVSPNGESEFSFQDSVRRQAERTAKGTTRERQLLNRNKLVSATCADYRMHFPSIYGKTERLPSEVTERIQLTGENKLTLKEQLFGCTMFISQAEKRLKELEAKPTPDYDREKAIKQQIMQLNLTKQFITGEIEHQSKLSANETSPK